MSRNLKTILRKVGFVHINLAKGSLLMLAYYCNLRKEPAIPNLKSPIPLRYTAYVIGSPCNTCNTLFQISSESRMCVQWLCHEVCGVRVT